KLSAVTGAPYSLQIIAVLNRTVKMGTRRGKCPKLPFDRANQNSGTSPELENFRCVGPEFPSGCRNDVILLSLTDRGRYKKLDDRIQNRNRCGPQTRPKQVVHKRTPLHAESLGTPVTVSGSGYRR